jgi:hypothetical protein
VGLITDESDNHAVKVEEEHDKVEAEFAERFLDSVDQRYISYLRVPSGCTYLLVNVQFPENLGSI